MKLDEYLVRGQREEFAHRVGVSVGTLHLICQERRRPGFDLAARISAETGGNVSIEELIGADIPPRARLRASDPIPAGAERTSPLAPADGPSLRESA